MKRILIVITVLSLLSMGLSAYLLASNNKPSKQGYVINQQLFDAFKGKQRLEADYKALAHKHNLILDSLAAIFTNDPSLTYHYQQLQERFAAEEEKMSTGYTAAIWKDINQYVSAYGDENGFEFIHGAAGEGTLMYANETNNITEDVILFINKRYEAN